MLAGRDHQRMSDRECGGRGPGEECDDVLFLFFYNRTNSLVTSKPPYRLQTGHHWGTSDRCIDLQRI